MKNPRLTDRFTKEMLDNGLLQYIGTWEIALGFQGWLVLVLEGAEERNCVAVLFGADVPLVLRPRFRVSGTRQVGLQNVITFYGMDLMRGQALNLARMEKLEIMEFTFMLILGCEKR